MEATFRIVLFLMVVAASAEDDYCSCPTNKRTHCAMEQGSCVCKARGSNHKVDCSTLTSKCLLMKAEASAPGGKRFPKPETGFLDNDGLYDPDCENSGIFKARQCNHTDTCWCVNSAGVRRTDKSDKNMQCNELVRTNWIFIELKHKERETSFSQSEVASSLRHLIQNRYMLRPNFISSIEYDHPFIKIDLKQNASQKSYGDVDIADVAYYFEKDIKSDSPFVSDNKFNITVKGEPLDIEKVLVYYVDEIPPEFSMQFLKVGIVAVAVVILVAILIGIAVFVFMRRWRTGKYEKVEIKEMGEMQINRVS
ncbi:tumor-associated calcium signal transducer 2 [Pantherophis guttatus]|uniref:Tumor-associated calcium signal transducer 2 n=1 Tax=Pantherophis guttatus TaxID=94885 RepID=A0A6P9BIF8_PANGU|nr:tumor-associated calcium signal transducer 2 [Pantherophis guttatus]